MRRRAKTDCNQAEIVAALRRIGCSVQSLAGVGQGVPDLLVGLRGANYLLEVKAERGVLTPDERDWHAGWHGQVSIVRSVDEALAIVSGE